MSRPAQRGARLTHAFVVARPSRLPPGLLGQQLALWDDPFPKAQRCVSNRLEETERGGIHQWLGRSRGITNPSPPPKLLCRNRVSPCRSGGSSWSSHDNVASALLHSVESMILHPNTTGRAGKISKHEGEARSGCIYVCRPVHFSVYVSTACRSFVIGWNVRNGVYAIALACWGAGHRWFSAISRRIGSVPIS